MDIGVLLSIISDSGGLDRQNRFEVYFNIATLVARSKAIATATQGSTDGGTDWITDFLAIDMQKEDLVLSAYCEKTELPNYQFSTESHRIYGPQFKIPHMPEYQDVTMTILCGANMYEKYLFDAWMYLIMDPMTNNFNYIGEYALDIDIVSYDEHDQQNYMTTLIEAYPISVNAMTLASDADNELSRVEVTFTYKTAIPFNGKDGTTNTKLRGSRTTLQQTITTQPA